MGRFACVCYICIYFVCSLIGTPFYIMEYVEGRIFKDRTLSGLTKQERKDIYSELINVLVKIHSVDISASGLDNFGKKGKGCFVITTAFCGKELPLCCYGYHDSLKCERSWVQSLL